jgi:CheY-like chemotaxis protein
MITSFGKEDVVLEAKNEKIDGVIIKPFSQSLLYNTILEVFRDTNESKIAVKKVIDNESLLKISGARILVVEENEINQQVILEILAKEGFIVSLADDGEIALDLIKNNDYDLILMDLQMPVKDGYETSKEIRRLGLKIPIIALSADAIGGIEAKVKKVGMNDYISKPVNVRDLFDKLCKWISPKRRTNSFKQAEISNEKKSLESEIALIQEKLPDFDVEVAITRIGSVDSYIDVLKKFSVNIKAIPNTLDALVENYNIEDIKKLLHTIKGVSGNIGAKKIFDSVIILESSIQEKLDQRELTLIGNLKRNINQALIKLNTLFSTIKEEEKITLNTEDLSEDLKVMLMKLLGLIEDEDLEAITFYKSIKTKYEIKGLEKLENLLLNYEFDDSHYILSKYLQIDSD